MEMACTSLRAVPEYGNREVTHRHDMLYTCENFLLHAATATRVHSVDAPFLFLFDCGFLLTPRKVVVIYSSLSTCDPGDIHETIAKLKRHKVRASVVGLGAEMVRLVTVMTQKTDR